MSSFFSLISRMKYINRWGLMHNTRQENLSEHSLDVAVIAHALGVIRNKRFGGDVNVERLCLLAAYHDAPEIITGDLPTPIKYYNQTITGAFKEIEKNAADELLCLLPEDLREEYEYIFIPQESDGELWKLVKAADKLSALIKCIEEQNSGNKEFDAAAKSTLAAVESMNLPEADCFLKEFVPAFYLTLDEQRKA